MEKEIIDNSNGINRKKFDEKILLGTLFAVTLIYIYQNVFPLNAKLIKYFFDRGVVAFMLGNLIPILVVFIAGVLFWKKMAKTKNQSMIRIYLIWLCSLLIYSILYRFQFEQILSEFLRKPINFENLHSEPKLLYKYVEPFFFPLMMLLIIYLVVLGIRKSESNSL